jgi:hypothetical protein
MRGPGFMQQSGQLPTALTEPAAAPVARPAEQEPPKVVVETREESGAATGLVAPSPDVTQVVQASANSAISGVAVEFPPGAVAIATEITVAPGENIASNEVVTQLQIANEVTAAATPVAVTSSVPMDTAVAFTIALPIPDDGGMALADPLSKLVVLYRIVTADGKDLTGVITRGKIDIKDGYARISTRFFGTYQAIITKELVVEAKELPSEQVITEQAPEPTPEPEQVEPSEEPKPSKRRYYVRGAAGSSFETGMPRSGSFQAWVHGLSPARVGHRTRLSTGYATKNVSGD